MTKTLDNTTRLGDWFLYVIRLGVDVDGFRTGHHLYGRRHGNELQVIARGGLTAILPLATAARHLKLCRYRDGHGIRVRGQSWQCARWDARRRGVKLLQAA